MTHTRTETAARIVRIAARGDGVTDDGRHAPGAVPGDRLAPDGTVRPGPHHVAPPCRHFAVPDGREPTGCGGCQLQHADEASLARFVTDRVVLAAQGQGLAAAHVAPPHLSPPRSRRRATLHAARAGKKVLIGFRAGRSNRIVDMAECHVLRPELFALVAPLRALLALWRGALAADIELAQTDRGVVCAIQGIAARDLPQTEALLDFARAHDLARLSTGDAYDRQTVWEPQPARVALGGVPVPFPHGAFLQATFDGEAALIAAARAWIGDAGPVADLFSGLGTFAFALADRVRVLAAEASREAHLACQAAARASGRPVFAQHRDLFRNPLPSADLAKFAAVLLDPPRAGARAQVEQIAASGVRRVVYISCNPASWARDAALLVAQGYRLEELRPVGQFRWSTHVELASLFVRECAD